MTRSSSGRCARRSGGATAASPACTGGPVGPRAAGAGRARPASTRPTSTTWSGAACRQVGEQSWNVGRNAVLAAGWPESVPGTTLDRQCGSSQQARRTSPPPPCISGQADLVVAGGVESMSRVPMGSSVGDGLGESGRRYRASRSSTRYGGDPVQPGRRRGDDRRALGLLPRPARRVLAGQPRAAAGRAGRRRLRRRDRARSRRRSLARRGHPAGHHAGEARRAEDAVQGRTAWSPPARRRRSPTARPRWRSPPSSWAAAARADARWPASTPRSSPPTTR